ncbi:hypothetical protein PMIN03_008964 [Paraphaeosphaeria minitans]
MRSTFIVATLALSSLAIPVPQSELEQGAGIHGCFRSNSPRDGEVDTRSLDRKLRACRITHPRDTEVDVRSPAPTPIGRGSHPRSVEDNETVKARAIRNEGLSHGAKPKGSREKRDPIYMTSGKRSVREKTVNTDEDIEARTVRPVKNQKRADEYDNANEDLGARTIGDMVKRSVREKTVSDDDDIEARAIRNEGKRSVREKTVSGDDIESRGTVRPSNKPTTDDDENIEAKRYAEAEPISRNTGSYRRDAEAEPGFTRAKPDHRREVEAEPLNRINGKKRTAEPTIPSQKRDASP